MGKIENDKYYTSSEVVELCLKLVKECLKEDAITEVIEPSAGNGAFSNKIKNCIAYDIEPEHPNITKQDFLTLNIEYKSGRLIIGNPPFGTRNTLAVKFFKKSVKVADYVAFVLPISQLNNNLQMYDFDLIKSVDLGTQIYTDRELRCCFNIYKRPSNGELNKKQQVKLNDVTIKEYRRGGKYKEPQNFDFSICNWGDVGAVPKFVGEYSQEAYFYVNDKNIYNQVKSLLSYDNIRAYAKSKSISTLKLSVGLLYSYFKENIEGVG